MSPQTEKQPHFVYTLFFIYQLNAEDCGGPKDGENRRQKEPKILNYLQ